jgi:membrane protein implicated in regulation of membrane protease activity
MAFGPEAGLGIGLVVLGIVVLVIEFTHPGLFLVIPAVVLIVVGLILAFAPPGELLTFYGVLFVVTAAVVAAIAGILWYRHMAPTHPPIATVLTSLKGEVGVVVAPVVPNTLKGKVRVKSEVWSARADQPIPVGTRVRVVGGEGVSILVQPEEAAPTPQVS